MTWECNAYLLKVISWVNQQHYLHCRDGDSVLDTNDNCPSYPNGDQSDIDGDGIGMF